MHFKAQLLLLIIFTAFFGISFAVNVSSCIIITTPGEYNLTAGLSGAPNAVSGVSGINAACIILASSDIDFNCNGRTITNSGVLTAAGIIVNGSSANNYLNITIRNCPSISGYAWGIHLRYTNSSNLTNNYVTGGTISARAISLQTSSNNTLTSNTAFSNIGFGFWFSDSNNNTLISNTAYFNSQTGFYFYNSDNNNLISTLAYANSQTGFYLDDSDNNILTSSTTYFNSLSGFYLDDSDNNNLTSSTAYLNSMHGFYLYNSDNNTLTGGTSRGNAQHGFYLYNSANSNISNMHVYDNDASDLCIWGGATPIDIYLNNIILDNPAGNYHYYTNFSLIDTYNERYYLRWTPLPTSLPLNTLPFAQKFMNITYDMGTPSIDTIVWNWLDSEVIAGGYNESRFELQKYNSSGWTLRNNTPNTSANTLSIYDHVPASTYGILQIIDVAPPTITIESPTNTTYNISTVDLNYTVGDDVGVDSCWFILDGGPINTSISDCSNTTLAGLSNA